MEEREDLSNQGNQKESLPTSQDGNNVSPSYNLNINKIDNIGGPNPAPNMAPPTDDNPAMPDSNIKPSQNQNLSRTSNVYPASQQKDKPVSPNSLANVGPQTTINNQATAGIENPNNSYACEVIDNIIPHRGIVWYILFTLVFMGSSALIIFYADWALLFVVIAVAGVLLWRGHQGTKTNLGITNESITLNNKKFLFDDINSFYFSKIGDGITINIILMKKYLPKLTFIFLNNDDAVQVKKMMNPRVPLLAQRDESYADLIIRKLKL